MPTRTRCSRPYCPLWSDTDNYPGDPATARELARNRAGHARSAQRDVAEVVLGRGRPGRGWAHKPPVTWVRGSADAIVSDTSLFDLAYLGQLGAVPGWPGAEACPPQPMVGQTRAVLERYAAAGGSFTEVVLDGCGHSPHIERPDEFLAALRALAAG